MKGEKKCPRLPRLCLSLRIHPASFASIRVISGPSFSFRVVRVFAGYVFPPNTLSTAAIAVRSR